MKRILTTVFALGAAAIFATGAGAGDKLRIGTEGAYPPFNFVDKDGQVQGFEVELGNAMCEAMKAECEWVVQDWDGIIPGLQAKKYDAVIASLYITDDRKKKIDFSNKYYQTPGRRGPGTKASSAARRCRSCGCCVPPPSAGRTSARVGSTGGCSRVRRGYGTGWGWRRVPCA